MTQHGKYETKILVLDDERLIRLAVCARLKNVGYDPVSVGTVQEAVSILKVHHRHGFDDLQRSKDVVGVRLRRTRDNAELTVWDCGRPVPSIKVAAGVTDTAFEIVNQEMSDHGRGRLMVRQLCDGIQRQRFGTLNETVFYIPWNNTEEGVQTA